jgi:hypothetical protein
MAMVYMAPYKPIPLGISQDQDPMIRGGPTTKSKGKRAQREKREKSKLLETAHCTSLELAAL